MDEMDLSELSNDDLIDLMQSEELNEEDSELVKQEYNKRLVRYKKELVEASIKELKRIDFAQSSMVGFVPYLNSRYDMQWFHKYIMERLDAFERGEVKRLIICLPPQVGKEISDNQAVMTKNGWKTHGELSVGDEVFGLDGQFKKVLAESERVQSTHRISFSDGTEIDCHANHEWVVHSFKSTKLFKTETKEMIGKLSYQEKRGDKLKTRYRFALPYFEPIKFQEKEVLIHPYVLGFWLGDGDSKSGRICKPHDSFVKIVDKINSLGYETSEMYKTTNDYDLYYCNVNGLVTLNKKLNIFGNKHIPIDYLQTSIQNRLELLAGLLDSDGCCYDDIRHKQSQRISFSNTNKQIVEGVKFICNSFGWATYWSEEEPKLSSGGIQGKQIVYRVDFTPTIPIPTVRLTINGTGVKRRRSIVKIEPLGDDAPMGKCIQVEGGVYLVGDTFIPTHNSELSTRNFVPYLVGKDPYRKVAVVCYGKDLVSGFNRDIKANLGSKEYKNLFPNIELGTRTGEMAVFENSLDKIDIVIKDENGFKKGGFIKTTAVTAPLTGTPVDILVMDDIYKDFDEAQSETTREQRWNWWWSVANSRLHNNSQVLFLMTRWHQEDLAGKLIEAQSGQWEIIRFPALKDNFQAEYDKRQIGDPLWGQRHSKERMEAVKAQNPVTFNALYQQDPKPSENLLVFGDWGELNTWNPRGIKFYGLDLGTNDPTALVEIWVDKDTIYLHELIYEVGLNNKSLMDRMRKLKVDGIVIIDTNEPKTTTELRENGFKIKTAIKGKHSIQAGIKKMKEFKVFFSPTSFNIKMERNNYVFITSGGKITNEPIASWNHIIDCSRFAVYTMFFRGKVNKSTTKKKSRIRRIGK